MKKFMIVMALCATALVANAQQVRTFHFEGGGYWVKVDLNKKTFLADGCGVETEKIQNYKKTGNKESFTTYKGGYTTHHVFTKKNDTDYTYTYWYTPSESKDKAVVEVTTKGSDDGSVAGKASGKVSEKVASKNPVNKVGNGVKGLFNKGKGLFKKDKGNAKAESKNNKEPKNQPVDDGSKPEK